MVEKFKSSYATLDSWLDNPILDWIFRTVLLCSEGFIVFNLVAHWQQTVANASADSISTPVLIAGIAGMVVSACLIFTGNRTWGPLLLIGLLTIAAPTIVPPWLAKGYSDPIIWPRVYEAALMAIGLLLILMSQGYPLANYAGRILFGGALIYVGVTNLAIGLSDTINYAAGLGAPLPLFSVPFSQLMLVVSGTSVLTGFYPRIGLLVFVVFLVTITPVMHQFWKDPTQTIFVLINVMLGSLALMLERNVASWPRTARLGTKKTAPSTATVQLAPI